MKMYVDGVLCVILRCVRILRLAMTERVRIRNKEERLR